MFYCVKLKENTKITNEKIKNGTESRIRMNI